MVGARPQFVKLAPIVKACAGVGVLHQTVHTGQHYEDTMSAVFFDELDIKEPEWNLGVGSGSHGAQTGAMLAGLDALLSLERPDWVVAYGDTNSTVAAALAAVKLRIPVAHLEAGLRSFNRAMPEEHNRVLTDHAADLLLAPTERAASHLAAEGLAERTQVVGDVMIDVLFDVVRKIESEESVLHTCPRPEGDYVLATIHRAENTDDPMRLSALITGLASLPVPVLLPVHPRLRDHVVAMGLSLEVGSLLPVQPFSYFEMVDAVMGSVAVVTDSGGLQKEAFVLGKPITTFRTETEWTETLENGWNVLAPDLEGLDQIVLRDAPALSAETPYGDGHAADAAVQALVGGQS